MNALIAPASTFEMRELRSEELDEISGGNAVVVAAGAVAAVAAMANALEGFGEKVGKALYHAIN